VCRHLAYVGSPVRLGSLLTDPPPHSLVHQAWAPRAQRHGTVNAYPALRVRALVADFTHQLHLLDVAGGRRPVAFLGGTIGNFDPAQRAEFLASVREVLGPQDRFLLGADLVKDPALLVAAYDDAAGVTAAFNRNLLDVLNRGWTPTSTGRRSTTSRCGTPTGNGSRCACGPAGRSRCGWPIST
jgi:Histidine-specific methyltransferase, SAM-dependent